MPDEAIPTDICSTHSVTLGFHLFAATSTTIMVDHDVSSIKERLSLHLSRLECFGLTGTIFSIPPG